VDNFFAQVVGTKRFILIEPKQTNRIVDGRLHKAFQTFDPETGAFGRDLERGVVAGEFITNYLPFDINNPDRSICPLFKRVPKCEAGDLFYQPYGWWHEVIGSPCPERGLCASISHFMAPYFARSAEPLNRGLQWPIKFNPEYKSLNELMIKKRLQIEAARSIQRKWRTHLQRQANANGGPAVKLKLTYFHARGRAELTRLTLAATGIPYEDERIEFDEFARRKEGGQLKFGQLPVLIVDGTQYGQSYAIAKFIARMGGLLPTNQLDQLEAEQYVDATDDIRSKFVPIRYMCGSEAIAGGTEEQDASKVAAYKKFYTDVLPTALRGFARHLGSNDFLSGGSLTLADIALYNLLYTTSRANCVVMAKSSELMQLASTSVAEFPTLMAHSAAVESNPGIAAWVQSRPCTDY